MVIQVVQERETRGINEVAVELRKVGGFRIMYGWQGERGKRKRKDAPQQHILAHLIFN